MECYFLGEEWLRGKFKGLQQPSLRSLSRQGRESCRDKCAWSDEAIPKRQMVMITFIACSLPFGDCFGPAPRKGP